MYLFSRSLFRYVFICFVMLFLYVVGVYSFIALFV